MKIAQLNIADNFKHKDREAILKYIELMYDKESPLMAEQNLDNRMKQALLRSKWQGDPDIQALKNKEIKGLVVQYINSQNENKFSLLISKQHLFYKCIQKILEPTDVEDEDKYLKIITTQGTVSDLASKLESEIAKLYSELYGSKELQETAMEQVRVIMSPEMRLKDKKKAN